MDESMIREALSGVAMPFGIALVLFAIVWRPWRPIAVAGASWPGAIAVGLAVILSQVALEGAINEKWERLAYAVAGATLAGLCAALPCWRRTTGAVAALLVAGAVAWLIAWLALEGDPRWLVIVPAPCAIIWILVMEPLAARRPGAALPLGLALDSFALAAILLLSGSKTFAIPCAAMGAAFGAAAIVASRCTRFSLSRGAMYPAAGAVVSLSMMGLLWGGDDLPRAFVAAFALAAFAPAMMWFAEAKRLASTPAWVQLALRCLLAAIPALAALAVAVANSDTSVYSG